MSESEDIIDPISLMLKLFGKSSDVCMIGIVVEKRSGHLFIKT